MTDPELNDVKVRVGGDTVRISHSTEFQHGQLVGGRYEVISRLGQGGMGLVYRVNQILLNKEFALKTIDKNSMSEIAIRRFQQEARTAFSLDHPSIIAVKDFGLLDDQTPFLVMELINGETLGERLKRAGCLTLDQAIPIFVQVCFGLAYAHECGIVHRDIKPNNIMLLKGLPLGAEGSVKILDFGIAKFTEHQGGEMQALTRTGEIFGSPLYMSPEQCSGFKVDHRADIYSLGCVLFEALTGTPPFMGDNALSTMMKHQGEPAPTLKEASLGTDFPQAIEDIVATMLAKSPDSRYQNLGNVAHDLGALRRGDSISSTAKQTAGVQAKAKARTISISTTRFYAVMIGIALLSAAIGGVLVYLFHSFHNGDSPEKPKTRSIGDSSAKELDLTPGLVDDSQAISPEVLKKRLARPTPAKQFALAFCKVSDESFALIAATSWIQHLSLENCDISNESLGRLAQQHLPTIYLGNSNFNDIGAARLSLCQDLQSIKVNSSQLSDEGVSKLCSIKNLKRLALDVCPKITDKSLIEIAKCKELYNLSLTGATQITNGGLLALEKTHLTYLGLASTRIDDAGMVYISKIDTLQELILDRTEVTINGINELCRSSKNLRRIDLQHCPNIELKKLRELNTEFPKIQFMTTAIGQDSKDAGGEPTQTIQKSIDEVLLPNDSADAKALIAKGKWEEAEPLLKRVLHEKEKALGPNSRDVAEILGYLGTCYMQQRGRVVEAEPLLKRALAIDEKVFGPNDLSVASTLGCFETKVRNVT